MVPLSTHVPMGPAWEEVTPAVSLLPHQPVPAFTLRVQKLAQESERCHLLAGPSFSGSGGHPGRTEGEGL